MNSNVCHRLLGFQGCYLLLLPCINILCSFRVPLKEAMESKRPLTRSVLESRISEVQFLLEDAVSRKAFIECAPLQEKLDKLIILT